MKSLYVVLGVIVFYSWRCHATSSQDHAEVKGHVGPVNNYLHVSTGGNDIKQTYSAKTKIHQYEAVTVRHENEDNPDPKKVFIWTAGNTQRNNTSVLLNSNLTAKCLKTSGANRSVCVNKTSSLSNATTKVFNTTVPSESFWTTTIKMITNFFSKSNQNTEKWRVNAQEESSSTKPSHSILTAENLKSALSKKNKKPASSNSLSNGLLSLIAGDIGIVTTEVPTINVTWEFNYVLNETNCACMYLLRRERSCCWANSTFPGTWAFQRMCHCPMCRFYNISDYSPYLLKTCCRCSLPALAKRYDDEHYRPSISDYVDPKSLDKILPPTVNPNQ